MSNRSEDCDPVKELPLFETAEDFLRELSPMGEHFRQIDPSNRWAFRGVGSDDYQLIPSALRIPSKLADFSSRVVRTNNSRQQAQAEFDIIKYFFHLADAEALPLPEDSQTLRQRLQSLSKRSSGQLLPGSWPPDDLLSLIALAQHSGVPTRLLDWTYNSHKAAYFAARDCVQLCRDGMTDVESRHLVVWAIDTQMLAIRRDAQYRASRFLENEGIHTGKPQRVPLHIVTAPTAGNPNLAAQQGLFTLYRPEEVSEAVDRRPLTQILHDDFRGHLTPLLLVFQLVAAEAQQALWWLAKEGITAAKIWPGYGGVARAMEETQYWKSP